MSLRVLVTDGEHRATLAVVRSLGRAGHEVHVCSSRTHAIAAASRHCRASARVSDPLSDPSTCVEDLRELCRRWRVQVLLPITEASIIAVRSASEGIDNVLMPLPPYAAFRAISDKAGLMRAAPRFGLDVPRQIELAGRDVLHALDTAELRFPFVIKPARSVNGTGNSRRTFEVQYAGDIKELHDRLERLPDSAYPVLLQQRVIGHGMGIMVLLWEGVPRAVFAHRRLREKPPSGGVSVYSESFAADPALISRVIDLLHDQQWNGVAMVEFKVEASTGKAYLMEVNGRFWGSLQLAIDAGVDFPRLLLECATTSGSRASSVTPDRGDDPVRSSRMPGRHADAANCGSAGYRAGVRLRWWWGDVDHLLLRLLKPRTLLNLPDNFPGRLQAIAEFSRLWRRGDNSEVFRWSDPRPGMVETLNWLRRR